MRGWDLLRLTSEKLHILRGQNRLSCVVCVSLSGVSKIEGKGQKVSKGEQDRMPKQQKLVSRIRRHHLGA
jgi:hypothetical protein